MTDATFATPDADEKGSDDTIDSMKQKAGAAADQLRSTVTEKASAAKDWAADQGEVIRDTVNTRPLVSIGVSAASAFAAGLMLGILLARR